MAGGKKARIIRRPRGVTLVRNKQSSSPLGGKQSSNCLVGEQQWLKETKFSLKRLLNLLLANRVDWNCFHENINEGKRQSNYLLVILPFVISSRVIACRVRCFCVRLFFCTFLEQYQFKVLEFHGSVFGNFWFYYQSKRSAEAVRWGRQTNDQEMLPKSFSLS